MTMIIAEGARDFGRKRLALRTNPDGEVEDHHIYPQQFLRNFGIKGYPANSVLNRTPILAATNRAISSHAPHTYIVDPVIVGEARIEDSDLAKHYISGVLLRDEFSPSLFAKFRKDRRAKLVQMISAITGQEIGVDASPDVALSSDL